MPSEPPVLSVVLSTYNRAGMLGDAVRSLLALDPSSPPHEIIVVDNNSRDRTREVVAELMVGAEDRLRYVFEPKQGLSNARNTGIRLARGRIIAFTDDDVRADPAWATALVEAFDAHPHVLMAGGKVLPMWPSPPPRWLDESAWGPLALLDAGPDGFETDAGRAVCFVGANMAFRREVFERFGNFDPQHHHAPGAVTAVEDHEFELRLYRAGARGWYAPGAVIHAEVQANRLTKAYHRKWHRDHGRAATWMLPVGHVYDGNWIARPAPPGARHLFGVPFFKLRSVLHAAASYARARVTGRAAHAMRWQGELWETVGAIEVYLQRRRAQGGARPAPAVSSPPSA